MKNLRKLLEDILAEISGSPKDQFGFPFVQEAKELNEEIDQTNQAIVGVEKKISEVEHKIVTLKEEIATLREEIGTLKKEVSEWPTAEDALFVSLNGKAIIREEGGAVGDGDTSGGWKTAFRLTNQYGEPEIVHVLTSLKTAITSPAGSLATGDDDGKPTRKTGRESLQLRDVDGVELTNLASGKGPYTLLEVGDREFSILSCGHSLNFLPENLGALVEPFSVDTDKLEALLMPFFYQDQDHAFFVDVSYDVTRTIRYRPYVPIPQFPLEKDPRPVRPQIPSPGPRPRPWKTLVQPDSPDPIVNPGKDWLTGDGILLNLNDQSFLSRAGVEVIRVDEKPVFIGRGLHERGTIPSASDARVRTGLLAEFTVPDSPAHWLGATSQPLSSHLNHFALEQAIEKIDRAIQAGK